MVLGLSSSKHQSATGAPYMTFTTSPRPPRTITALNSAGQQIATIGIQPTGRKGFTLSRTTPGSAQRASIGSATSSPFSGKTTLNVHGRQTRMRHSWEGMRSGKDIQGPTGKMVWRTGGSAFKSWEELTEERTGEVVARCKVPSLGKGGSWLEVLEQRDEWFVDLVVATWVVMLGD